MIQTLHECRLRGHMSVFVSNFLVGRRIYVRIGKVLSTVKEVPEGIAQGSALFYTGFIIAINKINCNFQPTIRSTLYVDDFCMYSSGPTPRTIERRLQLALNCISRWCFTTDLNFNGDKTFSMNICGKYMCPRMAYGFNLSDLPIKFVDNYKFLCVVIDNKLNWKAHIA